MPHVVVTVLLLTESMTLYAEEKAYHHYRMTRISLAMKRM